MKKYTYLLIVLLLVTAFSAGDAVAQTGGGRRAKRAEMRAKSREISKFTVKTKFGKSKQYASVGGYLGMSNYFGDLAPRGSRASTSLKLTRSYLGGFYNKRMNPNISWRVSLAWVRLRGDDFNANTENAEGRGRYQRNLSFRNNLYEVSGVGIIDILPTDRGYLRRNFLNGYGLLGVAVMTNAPKGLVPEKYGFANEGKWVKLRPLGTEGQGMEGYGKKYSWIQPAVILGGGLRYRVMDKLDLGLEIAWRFTFTDYLDDVSGQYVPYQDKFRFQNGEYVTDANGNYIKDIDSPVHESTSPDDPGTYTKEALWFAMSNKSGNPLSSTGRTRDWKKAGKEKLTPDDFASFGPPENNMKYLKGNEFGAAPRGNPDRDGFTVTTLTATYILEYRARTPKFR